MVPCNLEPGWPDGHFRSRLHSYRRQRSITHRVGEVGGGDIGERFSRCRANPARIKRSEREVSKCSFRSIKIDAAAEPLNGY